MVEQFGGEIRVGSWCRGFLRLNNMLRAYVRVVSLASSGPSLNEVFANLAAARALMPKVE